MEEIFYAKSVDETGHQETVKEHLSKAACLAEQFGEEIGRAKEAYLCGLFHDFGKYSQSFKGVLKGTKSNVDHALGGAAYLYCVTKEKKKEKEFSQIIECIYGHHDGLVSLSELQAVLQESCSNSEPITCPSGKCSALSGKEYLIAKKAFQRDFPEFRFSKLELAFYFSEGNVKSMLHTRMLFSCLVDGDYSASAGKLEWEQHPLQSEKLLVSLEKHCQNIKKKSDSDLELNRLRDNVYECCGKAGETQEPGIFTLTAPTGTGKTLALIHFALRHCRQYHKRRIIVVLPFLTLTEQSESVYQNIFPNILSDHSQSKRNTEENVSENTNENEEKKELEKELVSRWDAPLIITTSVKFFESLFACQPTDCRKLHNIADSVIIFDEAQSLPAQLLPATLQAVQTLCDNYRCTMVFSTATQPNFAALEQLSWQATEIYPEYPSLYQALRRTKLVWKLNHPTPFSEIAEEMAKEKSVCAIVNLRRHARILYEALKSYCKEDSLFYLTTDLCPAHRSQKIEAIKERLSQQLPCYVVSTQCIEAGVDLDFEVLYRALAPLEAIIQAAGRCNRNGKIPQGRVIVFEPEAEGEKSNYPGEWYQKAAITVKTMFKKDGLDIHDPACIAEYYRQLFSELKEDEKLVKALEEYNYKAVEASYHLITKQGYQIIVPYSEKLALYEEICTESEKQWLTVELIRKAAPITVSTFDVKGVELHCEPLYFRSDRKRLYPSGYYLLVSGQEECYSTEIGIQFPEMTVEDYMC